MNKMSEDIKNKMSSSVDALRNHVQIIEQELIAIEKIKEDLSSILEPTNEVCEELQFAIDNLDQAVDALSYYQDGGN